MTSISVKCSIVMQDPIDQIHWCCISWFGFTKILSDISEIRQCSHQILSGKNLYALSLWLQTIISQHRSSIVKNIFQKYSKEPCFLFFSWEVSYKSEFRCCWIFLLLILPQIRGETCVTWKFSAHSQQISLYTVV